MHTAFREQHLQPLGHLSSSSYLCSSSKYKTKVLYYILLHKYSSQIKRLLLIWPRISLREIIVIFHYVSQVFTSLELKNSYFYAVLLQIWVYREKHLTIISKESIITLFNYICDWCKFTTKDTLEKWEYCLFRQVIGILTSQIHVQRPYQPN